MRKIKFRAWNKTWKRMIDNVLANSDVVLWTFNLDICHPDWDYLSDDIKVMQFTGIVDKTKFEELTVSEQQNWLKNHQKEDWRGKKIYEGDIVTAWDSAAEDENWGLDKYHVGVIEYIDNCFSLNCSNIYLNNWINAENIKVMGNIYQNPELLEINHD